MCHFHEDYFGIIRTTFGAALQKTFKDLLVKPEGFVINIGGWFLK